MTTPFKGKKQAFEWPKLSLQELVTAFNQLDIPCTVDELKGGEPDAMRRVAFGLVEFMMGLNRDELRARPPQFAAMEVMTHPELHDESNVEHTLARAYLRLCGASGVTDASLMGDLYNPTPARARHVFSAIINFAKFRQDRLAAYVQYSNQTKALVQLRAELESHAEKIAASIAELRAQRQAEEPVIAQVERESAELAAKINALAATHGAVKDDAAKLKAQAQDLENQIREHEIKIATHQKESDKLRGQIVRSPERMKKTIADMSASVAAGRKDVADSDAKARELRAKHQTLVTVCEKVQERVADLKECDEQMQKSKKLYKEIKDTSKEVSASEQKIAELSAQQKQLRAETNHVAERLVGLREQFQKKHEQSTTALAKVEAERAALLRVKEKDNKKIEDNEQRVAQLKAEMAKMEKSTRDELAALKDSYADFAGGVRQYHEKLLEAMG